MPGIGRQKVTTLRNHLEQGASPSWLLDALGRDAARFAGALGSGFMAPGNALAGNYDQVEIGPNGAVTPIDPRMISDANNLAGMVSLGSVGGIPKGALGMGIKAYHGSPHSFDKFSMDKIGTGEGAQAYGHGLYFAENEGVAKGYREQLTNDVIGPAKARLSRAGGDPDAAIASAHAEIERLKGLNLTPESGAATRDSKIATEQAAIQQLTDFKNTGEWKAGHSYAVDINAQPEHFLDWDKPLSEQPAPAIDALKQLATTKAPLFSDPMHKFAYENLRNKLADPNTTGQELYHAVGRIAGKGVERSDAGATDLMRQAGVKGIKYLDAGSRAAGDGTRNYVVFDDKSVNIDKKYGALGGVPNVGSQAGQPLGKLYA